MIEVPEVKATPEELGPFSAWDEATRRLCVPLYVQIAGLLAVVLIVAGMSRNTALTIIVAVTALATFLLEKAAAQWALAAQQRVHRATPMGSAASTYVIDDEGLHVRNPHGVSLMRWSAMKGVLRDRNRFVFLVSPNNNTVLPRRLMSSAQELALIDMIAGAGVELTDGPPGVD